MILSSSKPNMDNLLRSLSRVDILLRAPQLLPLPRLCCRFNDEVLLLLPLQFVATDDKLLLLALLLLFGVTDKA